MRKLRYFFVFLCVLALSACQNDSTNPADTPNSSFEIEKMYGEWQLVPSRPIGSKIDFAPDGRILYKYKNVQGEPEAKALTFTLDSLGMRIHYKVAKEKSKSQNDANKGFIPLGYFLLAEKKANSWPGIWRGEVVKLIRQGNQPASILK